MISVMIIEDEPTIRMLLRKIVEKQDGFEVVAEAGTFAEGITDFSKFRPDVAFVDIDLNGESGLECAKVMTNIDPDIRIIFATAHSEYMANAFEIYAFDYIVKPFDVSRVERTLRRIRDAVTPQETAEHADPADNRDRLLIKGRDQVSFVETGTILFIERVENSTSIVTETETFRTSASLTDLEVKLPADSFMRCHKSYIINTRRITSIEPYGRWTFIAHFKGTDATALITSDKYNELRSRYET